MSKKEKNSLKRTTIYFGKKDGFLCEWAQSLPWGTFSFIVKEAIRAYLDGDKEYNIPKFSHEKKEYKESINMALSISKDDHEIYTYITSLDSYNRANQIKKILKFYLIKNREQSASSKQPHKTKTSVDTPKREERPISKRIEKREKTATLEIESSKELTKKMMSRLMSQSKIMDSGNYN